MKKSSTTRAKDVNLEKLKSSIKLDFGRVDIGQIIQCEMENFGLQLGFIVMEQFMQAEAEQLTGPKYSRENGSDMGRWGSQVGSVVLGGQKTAVKKPRVRRELQDGSTAEVPLEAERRSHKLKGFALLKQLKENMHHLITNPTEVIGGTTTKINSKNINKTNKTKRAA